jgi:4-hydroxybenzoate polyprenyltransferase
MNFLAYFNERFAPVNMALFSILFATVGMVAGHTYPAADPTWGFWLGFIPAISFFFRLRVFDEIKDYDQDMINHPGRVLQSGRISLRQLMGVAAIGTALEGLWSGWMGTSALVGWLLALGYSLLMRYEFFRSAWLKPRLLLYALSHMAVMPLIILWLWWAFSPGFALGRTFGLLAALAVLGGFSFELARKVHAPYAERPTVDSYSQFLGYTRAIWAVLAVLLTGVLALGLLLHQLDARAWPYYLVGLLYLGTLGLYAWLMVHPQEKGLRRAERLVSLFMLLSYIAVLIEA